MIIGGPSRHYRLSRRAVRRLIRFAVKLAGANHEALQIVTSPRTPAPVLAELRGSTASFILHEFGGTPFSTILQSGSRFVVTADSASMLGEACRSGAAVWLFALPPQPNLSDLLQHSADYLFGPALRHRLVRRGWVGGGTNFHRWHCALQSLSYMRIAGRQTDEALRWAPAGSRPDTDLRDCRARILAMLKPGLPGSPAGAGDDGTGKDFYRLRP